MSAADIDENDRKRKNIARHSITRPQYTESIQPPNVRLWLSSIGIVSKSNLYYKSTLNNVQSQTTNGVVRCFRQKPHETKCSTNKQYSRGHKSTIGTKEIVQSEFICDRKKVVPKQNTIDRWKPVSRKAISTELTSTREWNWWLPKRANLQSFRHDFESTSSLLVMFFY